MPFLLALYASKPLRYAVGALALMLVYQGWKTHQRALGAERLKTAITKKADDNAKQADAVRDDTASSRVTSRVRTNPLQRAGE